MPRCKICSGNMMVTIDDICLICNPPTEKQIDIISTIMVMVTKRIRELRNSS